MKEIPLTRGKVTIVSDWRFEELSKFKWNALLGMGKFYAARKSNTKNGKRYLILMHRIIAGTPDGMDTDHINGDTLDNRDENLRTCNPSQNQANQRKKTSHSSRFKGVDYCKHRGKWRARIRYKKKLSHIGLFDSEVDAARAYDAKARELQGEYAATNFPTKLQTHSGGLEEPIPKDGPQ